MQFSCRYTTTSAVGEHTSGVEKDRLIYFDHAYQRAHQFHCCNTRRSINGVEDPIGRINQQYTTHLKWLS